MFLIRAMGRWSGSRGDEVRLFEESVRVLGGREEAFLKPHV